MLGLADRVGVLVRFFFLFWFSFLSYLPTTSEVDNNEVDHESSTTEEPFCLWVDERNWACLELVLVSLNWLRLVWIGCLLDSSRK